MTTPNEHFRASDAQVEQGFIYCLLPRDSKELFEQGIEVVAQEMSADRLQIKAKSNLDFDPGDIAEQVWTNIQKAEVVLVDLTNYDPQVMCEVGISLSIKDSRKIVLLRDIEMTDQDSDTPVDLKGLSITHYDRRDLTKLKNKLRDRLHKSIDAGPAPPVLPTLEARQIVDEAIANTRSQRWPLAEFLFQQIDEKIPDNWYILTQWGIMYREKGDFPKAEELLLRAAQNASYDEYKASVLVEQALLAFAQRKIERAGGLFGAARTADPTNRQVYVAWAEVYDKLDAPERSLGQIAELLKVRGKQDEEALILMEFYSRRTSDRSFKVSLEDFKKAWHAGNFSKPSKTSTPTPGGTTARDDHQVRAVPERIPWPAFATQYKGALVMVEVKNVHPLIGVFFRVNPDFVGLLPKSKAGSDFQTRFSAGQKIRVKICDIYLRQDGNRAIDLIPA